MTFDVYFGQDESNLRLKAQNLTKNSYTVTDLEYGTTYYWKVVVKDIKGATSEGPIWKFTTKEKEEESSATYIAVTGGPEGLFIIIDVSDPENPQVIGHVDTDGYAYGVYVSEGYAYVAGEENGLVIVDVSDPSNPQIVGHVNVRDTRGVYVSEEYAYVADGSNGLVVMDVSDPEDP